MKPSLILTDKKDEYFPYWVIVNMSKEKLIIVIIFLILFWTFLYKLNIFEYKSSLVIGSLINIFIVVFFYLINEVNSSIYWDVTNNKWVVLNQPPMEGASDLVTDLDKFKDDINIKKDGLVVSTDYVKKHNLKVITLAELYSSRCITNKTYKKDGWSCISDNDKQQQRVSNLINFKDSALSSQGYDILSIIFTLSTLIYNIDKTLFKKLIVPLFKFIIVPAISMVYFERIFYNEDRVLGNVVNNYMFVFLTVSVIISIMADIINIFKKK